jgi:hypothetical protein
VVIWDDHEKGEKGLSDGKQVVIDWLPFEGGKVSWASLKRWVIA